MTIHHYIPPAAKRVGGLDTALNGLHTALVAHGVVSRLLDDPHGAPGQPLPDVAHFHGLWNFRHCRLSVQLARAGVPVVVSPHGMLEPWALNHRRWKKRPFFHFLEKNRLLHAEAVLATSALEKRGLENLLPGARITELPLGVDVPEEAGTAAFRREARQKLGLAPTARMVLFLSRIDRKKGLDLLLQAWHELAGPVQTSQAVLWIVGGGADPAYERECRQMAEACRATGARVEWSSAVWGDDRWKFFAAADLFCLPSHSENYGLVIPEAWGCGTPVLTTRHTPWCGPWEGPGLQLVDLTPTALRQALHDALEHRAAPPADRDLLSARVRSELSWEALVPAWMRFYSSLGNDTPLSAIPPSLPEVNPSDFPP